MEALARARQVANYIREIGVLGSTEVYPRGHNHIGATLADAVLQAGLNYRSVVLPRVKRIQRLWPTSRVASGFLKDLHSFGAHEILNWSDIEKPRRLRMIAQLIADEQIETEADLLSWLSVSEHKELLLNVRGIGPKTVDYLFRLVGGPGVAVDRHLARFVGRVCPSCTAYEDICQVVCYAADLLSVDRGYLDQLIWRLMSSSEGPIQ